MYVCVCICMYMYVYVYIYIYGAPPSCTYLLCVLHFLYLFSGAIGGYVYMSPYKPPQLSPGQLYCCRAGAST